MKKQLALCIGNDNYLYSCLPKLRCAINDATSVAQKLESLNYEVLLYTDLDREKIHKAIDDFESRLPQYDVALFYFAGHGFECNGKNLLMPIDVAEGDNGYREWMALTLDTVISALEGKNVFNHLTTKIIILDACRQNPDARGNQVKGFAPVFAPSGTIIAFSTSPGQLSLEAGNHGLYTKALLASIDTPRIPVENMFKHVREILIADSRGKQISWEHTSLIGNYYFNEDRIDAFAFYSAEALADRTYYFNPNTQIGKVVEKLKSYYFNTQNEAIPLIKTINFSSVSASDLFVLGRNIYQAADGGAWTVINFIKTFSNQTTISHDVKIHLLNGMAYEIYFNSYGVLRERPKNSLFLEILKLLEDEHFQKSKNFIAEKLRDESGLFLYIPGSEERIELHVQYVQIDTMENGDKIFKFQKIFYQAKNILYTGDGTEEIDSNYAFWATTYSLPEIKRILAERMVAPPDMIIFTLENENLDNYYFTLPEDFSLRYKKVEID